MKPSKHKLIRRLFVVALLAFLGLGWFGPGLFDHHGKLARHVGYAQAANRHIIQISRDTMLFHRPLLVVERASVSLLPPRSGRALSDQEIATKLQDGTADLVVEDAKILIDDTGLHPARSGMIPDAVKSIIQPVRDLSFRTITVVDAKVTGRPALAGGPSLLGRLTCVVTKEDASTLQIEGKFEREVISVPFDLSLDLAAADKAAGLVPVKFSSSSPLLNLSLAGNYIRDDELLLEAQQSSVSMPSAKDVLSWIAGQPVRGSGMQEFQATGALKWTGSFIHFQESDFVIDGNEASGGLSVRVDGERPMVDGTLGFENLELAPYVNTQRSALEGLRRNALDWTRWLAGDNVGNSLLKSVDADLRLSASTVTTHGALLGGGAASITIKDGRMLADLAEMKLDETTQGNARIEVDLSGRSASYGVRGVIDTTDIGSLTRIFSHRQMVSGAGRVEINLSAEGASQRAFRDSLGGTVMLSMPDGGSLAFDLASLMSAASNKSSTWGEVADGTTPVDMLDATLTAENGVLTAKSVQAQTESRTLQVDGTIDLPNQTVDLSVASSPKKPVVDMVTRERVHIRGPLLAPVIHSEFARKAELKVQPQQQ